ncbi:MAG: hypothetical protein JWM27_3509 [Gemmatimonadetes bacterium]|nr:hypothetical protein [Gemmatimonadota bacterium]
MLHPVLRRFGGGYVFAEDGHTRSLQGVNASGRSTTGRGVPSTRSAALSMRRLLPLLAVLPLLPFAAPPWANAQELIRDTRIRVTAPGLAPQRQVGRFVGMRGDTLLAMLGTDSTVMALPTASLARVEASRGSPARRGRGALVGAGIGGAVAFLTVYAIASRPGAGEEDYASIFAVLFVTPVTVGGGAIIGALSAPRREQWSVVRVAGVGLVPGARVRVWAVSPRLYRADATLQQVRGDTLVLRVGGGLVTVPADAVTRLDVRQGGASWGQGARHGAVRGLLVGGVLGAAGGAVVFPGDDAYVRSTLVGQGIMIGVGLGATLGAVVGAVHPGDAWTPSRTPVRVTVGRTVDGGTKLGASIRF